MPAQSLVVQDPTDLIGLSTARRIIGCSRPTIRLWAATGRIKSAVVDGRILTSVHEARRVRDEFAAQRAGREPMSAA